MIPTIPIDLNQEKETGTLRGRVTVKLKLNCGWQLPCGWGRSARGGRVNI